MLDSEKERCAVIAYNTFVIKHGARARIARYKFIDEFKRSLMINDRELFDKVCAEEHKLTTKSQKKALYVDLITYNRYILKSGCECNGGQFKLNLGGK